MAAVVAWYPAINDAVSRTGITLSTVYHFQKMWNENQEVYEKKKRNCVDSGTHIVYCETYWQFCTQDFKTDERKFNWKVSKHFYFQNTILLPHLKTLRFKESRKTYRVS
jgi:hypothetical protein